MHLHDFTMSAWFSDSPPAYSTSSQQNTSCSHGPCSNSLCPGGIKYWIALQTHKPNLPWQITIPWLLYLPLRLLHILTKSNNLTGPSISQIHHSTPYQGYFVPLMWSIFNTSSDKCPWVRRFSSQIKFKFKIFNTFQNFLRYSP